MRHADRALSGLRRNIDDRRGRHHGMSLSLFGVGLLSAQQVD